MEISRQFQGLEASDGLSLRYKIRDGTGMMDALQPVVIPQDLINGMLTKFGVQNEQTAVLLQISAQLNVLIEGQKVNLDYLKTFKRSGKKEGWLTRLLRRVRGWVGKEA